MEESVDRSTSESILIKLFSDSFPQFNFPHVKYTENTETDGSLTYSACIKLLGQNFNSGPKPSKELALEAVSSVAYEVVKEFRQLVLLETDSSLGCESLSSLFRPLKEEAVKVAKTVSQEAIRSVSIINSRLVEVENEKINMKVKAKNDKIVEKMQLPTSALIESRRIEPVPVEMAKIEMEPSSQIAKSSETDSKFQETKPSASPPTHSDPNIRLSPLNISENDANVPKKTATERKTNIGAPIPAFYEFVEKQSSTEPIIFDDFIKGANYGCRLRWGQKSWVAPAEHRQKKDAHNLAAVMACIELFGEGFTFEGVDPRIYVKWSRESVRKASDRYIFATSDELLAQESLNPPEPVDSSKLTVEPLSDGRKFTSVINEICQKMRFTPPNYQVSSVNALTNYYICTVKNFHDLPPMESLPFTKKNEAKEDTAAFPITTTIANTSPTISEFSPPQPSSISAPHEYDANDANVHDGPNVHVPTTTRKFRPPNDAKL
ncbi:hypothetical protein C9890_0204 [Perkinsus sp. BL_2016]|nr:hypothetical protein C9890_0204 [Perkinsus sp. BL_2016]